MLGWCPTCFSSYFFFRSGVTTFINDRGGESEVVYVRDIGVINLGWTDAAAWLKSGLSLNRRAQVF